MPGLEFDSSMSNNNQSLVALGTICHLLNVAASSPARLFSALFLGRVILSPQGGSAHFSTRAQAVSKHPTAAHR